MSAVPAAIPRTAEAKKPAAAAGKDKEKPQLLIVRRVKRGHGGGHHGGAWKVAYADFVTAMMAFFLVMWLVGTSSKVQRGAIAEYFKNPSMEAGTSMVPSQSMGPGGAANSMIQMSAITTPKSGESGMQLSKPSPSEVEKLAREQEKKSLEALMQNLKEAIDKSQALQPFKDQLLLDITPDGLRIQIVDKQSRPMFDSGSTTLKPYTGDILRELATFINTVPNKISLSGHTDTAPYSGGDGYTNWELSSGRANAARRALVGGGMQENKVALVIGLADSVLFDKNDPRNPINRRISIVVMNKAAEKAALESDSESPTASDLESGAATAPPIAAAQAAASTPETANASGMAAATSAAPPPVDIAPKLAPTAPAGAP
jgi:chemotaxis protein MotB